MNYFFVVKYYEKKSKKTTYLYIVKNVKKILDKLVGKKILPIKITIRVPWDSRRISMRFDLEILSAKYDFFSNPDENGDYFISVDMKVTNKLIDDFVDDEEFEFRFQNLDFYETLKEELYIKYKISEVFGVVEESFELSFEL